MRLRAMRTARFTGRLSCPPPAHCKQNDRCANITIPVLRLPAQINKGQDICYSSSLHTTQLDPFQKQNTRMRLRAMRTARFTGRLSCPPPAHCKQNDRCANITTPVLRLPAQKNNGQDICYSSSLHTTQLDPFQKQNITPLR